MRLPDGRETVLNLVNWDDLPIRPGHTIRAVWLQNVDNESRSTPILAVKNCTLQRKISRSFSVQNWFKNVYFKNLIGNDLDAKFWRLVIKTCYKDYCSQIARIVYWTVYLLIPILAALLFIIYTDPLFSGICWSLIFFAIYIGFDFLFLIMSFIAIRFADLSMGLKIDKKAVSEILKIKEFVDSHT